MQVQRPPRYSSSPVGPGQVPWRSFPLHRGAWAEWAGTGCARAGRSAWKRSGSDSRYSDSSAYAACGLSAVEREKIRRAVATRWRRRSTRESRKKPLPVRKVGGSGFRHEGSARREVTGPTHLPRSIPARIGQDQDTGGPGGSAGRSSIRSGSGRNG